MQEQVHRLLVMNMLVAVTMGTRLRGLLRSDEIEGSAMILSKRPSEGVGSL